MVRELTMEEEINRDYYIKKALGYEPGSLEKARNEVRLQQAIEIISKNLQEDRSNTSLYNNWKTFMAMHFIIELKTSTSDEYSKLRESAYRAAEQFLNSL